MKSDESGFTLIELMIVVAIIAILAAIAIAQYKDYAIRAQISEGATLADGVKSSIAEFYQNMGRFGADNDSFGLAPPASIAGRYVAQVDAAGGVIDVTFGGTSHAEIQGRHLTFSPIVHQGSIEWVCNRSNTLDEKYVPPVCRDNN